jgi:adenosylhomocysteine nucleosidase
LPTIGIITGTRPEEACLSDLTHADAARIVCSGASAAAAEVAARQLVADGCAGLASIGTAGGLDPALAPGAVVLCDGVYPLDGGGVALPDDAWTDRLAAGLVAGGFTLRRGCLLGAGTPLLTPEDKARVFAETGASVVDMESDAVARVAMEVGLPWIALRVVADPAGLALPALAARSIKPDGRVDLAGLLCGLARRPGQIGGFLALARSGRKALGALRRVAALGLFFEPL